MIGDKEKAFTLVELLVAVAIFVLTALIAVGLLISVLRGQRKSIAIQNVQDNGRYLIGFMAKEIRMSEIISSDGETTVLNVTEPALGDITYRFTGNDLERNGDKINSDEVRVQGRFFIDGKTAGDDEQPRVAIVMKVETTGAKSEEKAEINLQTTLSSRKY